MNLQDTERILEVCPQYNPGVGDRRLCGLLWHKQFVLFPFSFLCFLLTADFLIFPWVKLCLGC